MRFQIIPFITAALSVSTASAQLSAPQVIDNINEITKLSADTIDVAQGLTNPFSLITSAPRLVNNFSGIVKTVLKDITAMKTPPKDKFAEDDQLDICDAFAGFVNVHQKLLNIIIGKNGFFAGTPFTAPIAAVLRLLEKGVDTLAFSIIGLVPTCEDEAKKNLNALDGTIGEAITKFS